MSNHFHFRLCKLHFWNQHSKPI